MSLWLSGFYLALVAAVPLLQPLVGLPPLKLMEVSSLFLGPVNALVGLALGAFFVSKGRGS